MGNNKIPDALKDIVGYINFLFHPEVLTSAFVFSSLLLFLPLEVYQYMGVNDFIASIKLWIVMLWFLSISIIIAKFIVRKKEKFSHRNIIRNLGSDEKRLLAKYIIYNRTTVSFGFSEDAINRLVALEVVSFSSLGGGTPLNYGVNYFIQPWAWKIIKNDHELLAPELRETYEELKRQNKM